MNQKSLGRNKYRPQVARPNWESFEDYQLSERTTLKPGMKVKIKGVRAAEFTYLGGEKNTETGAISLNFVGGKAGHLLDRQFRPERVSKVMKQR